MKKGGSDMADFSEREREVVKQALLKHEKDKLSFRSFKFCKVPGSSMRANIFAGIIIVFLCIFVYFLQYEESKLRGVLSRQ